MNLYKHLIRPAAFRLDPERAHDFAIDVASAVSGLSFVEAVLSRYTRSRDPRLRVSFSGLDFENPIGLAAGYDKSGRAVDGMAALGFGHVEVGSVSIDPSDGNPKPRLFRLPDDEAVIVHYGLQNDGALVVRDRLVRRQCDVPVGVNIVKTNRGIGASPESTDQIIDEYIRAVRSLDDSADYLTLNLSCPNTEDGRDFFADVEHTRLLLSGLSDHPIASPLFLKISPLGSDRELDHLLDVIDGFEFLDGFVFNLAPGVHADLRSPPAMWSRLPGALAGKPVEQQMNERIRFMYDRMDHHRYRIIGAGGVTSAADAYRKIRLGASLVQLLTALVYEGPLIVKRINEGLSDLMDRDGIGHISEAVGADTEKG